MAWREAWRSKGRSALVLVMVTFPVVAVVAADVAQATSSVSSVEGLDRRLGSAEARVQTLPDTRSVFQTADPDSGGTGSRGRPRARGEPALHPGRPSAARDRSTELRQRQLGVSTDIGVLRGGRDRGGRAATRSPTACSG